MLKLPTEVSRQIFDWGKKHIPDDWLTGDGRESVESIHTTVIYGLETPNVSDLEPYLPKEPVKVALGPVSRFTSSDEFDVIKVEVYGDALLDLHETLKANLKNKQTHGEFKGHATIAYVVKGKGAELDQDKTFDGLELELTTLDWSPKGEGGQHEYIEIGKEPVKTGWFLQWPINKWASSFMGKMVDSYLETAIWSTNDESTDAGGEPLDKSISIQNLDRKFVEKAKADCQAFWDKVWELGDFEPQMLGHHFWLTRNRHGTGFWDGDYPKEIGEKLTEIAHSFGEVQDVLEYVPTKNNQGGPGIAPPEMELDSILTVNPETEFDNLIRQRDSGEITPQQFQSKSRNLFSSKKVAEQELGLKYSFHNPKSGQRMDVTLAQHPMGLLWRIFLTEPGGHQKELTAFPANYGFNEPLLSEDRLQATIKKLQDNQGPGWLPIDINQEKALKKDRGQRFEDFYRPEEIRREILMLLSNDPKDYQSDEGYSYGLDFLGDDYQGFCKMMDVEWDEEFDGDCIEEAEEKLSGLAQDQLRAWNLPGSLFIGTTDGGDKALIYHWDDDDIAHFKQNKPINLDPDSIRVMNPQEEIDTMLEQYQDASPEQRQELEQRIQDRHRHAGININLLGITWF